MGRKALHTPEEVFAAADRLAAEGRDVTASALLASLGGGSLTTIYRHLEAWEASRKDAPRPVAIEMPEAVSAAFARAWQAAAQEAGKEIAAIREKADAEVKEMRKRYEEALASIERLETEAEADAEQIESLTVQLADLDATLREATTREAALKATVGQIERQIEAQQAELEQERQAASTAREEAARWRGQVEVLREQIKGESKVKKPTTPKSQNDLR